MFPLLIHENTDYVRSRRVYVKKKNNNQFVSFNEYLESIGSVNIHK